MESGKRSIMAEMKNKNKNKERVRFIKKEERIGYYDLEKEDEEALLINYLNKRSYLDKPHIERKELTEEEKRLTFV